MGKKIPLPAPVAAIYRATNELRRLYPQRKFTPDGHLVGSIGEVVAAEALGLTLHPMSMPGPRCVRRERQCSDQDDKWQQCSNVC